jgi:ankyrin repeat protein
MSHLASNSLQRENIIKILLKDGAPTDLNTQTMQRNDYPYRFTPLGFAIRDKNTAMVKLLLDHGANPNQRDAEGYTPLHRAGSIVTTIVKLLLDHGANPNQRDVERYTPLHRAAMKPDNTTIIRLLIQRGANVDAKTEGLRHPVAYEVGLTPLHLATYRTNIENVRTLVDIGKAKVNVKSSLGNTPLHKAASRENGERIAQFLIDRGAHVNVKDRRGQTPLHKAVACGLINTVKMLLNNGAIPFIQDSSGDTPSNLAKDFKYINIEHMLRTWPGERSILRRMATASMNSVRNRNTGNRLHMPNNVKQRILSKTGLFRRNQYGRPINGNNAEIRNAWTKEQQRRKRKRNNNS